MEEKIHVICWRWVRKEGRPQQVVCYRYEGETEGWDLEEEWDQQRAADRLPLFLPKWPLGCYGMSAGVGGWAKAMCGRREVRRERSCDPLEMGTGWEDCHSWRSAAEMLRRLRDWTWRR